MRNIRLTIAYDGSGYAGWQVQPDTSTIQGTIEAAIKRLTGEEVRIHGSGRTDAGVHALGQVANFHTAATIPPERWQPALNGVLPNDIVIQASEEADAGFHARFSAKQKTYRYVIHNSVAEAIPFLRTHAWRVPVDFDRETMTSKGGLDLESMTQAAASLVGTHDFSSFESKSVPEESSVRTVSRLVIAGAPRWKMWFAGGSQQREFCFLEITADGFLYNMVRAIVGTLVEIGVGARPVDDMQRVLKARDRSQAGPTAPPQGLYLVSVDYDQIP